MRNIEAMKRLIGILDRSSKLQSNHSHIFLTDWFDSAEIRLKVFQDAEKMEEYRKKVEKKC